MYFKNIITLLTLFLTASLFGQSIEMDQVYLSNDKNYIGKIVEQQPGEYIKLIEQNTSDTLTFNMDEIQKVIKVSVPLPEQIITTRTFNNNQFGLLLSAWAGGGDVANQGLGLGIIYRPASEWSLSLQAAYFGETGSGISQSYQWQKIPVWVHGRYELQRHFNNRGAITAGAGLGYSFSINGDFQDPDTGDKRSVGDGLIFKPSLGYRCNFTSNTGILIETSYQLLSDSIKDSEDSVLERKNWDTFQLGVHLFF